MSKLQAHNEAIIHAPVSKVWAIITDITLLDKINPGVIAATGRMDKQGETRTCEMMNGGKKGKMTERLAELVHEKKTVWVIENDSMGMGKMLIDPKFCFYLEKICDNQTKIRNESYYLPANLMVRIMNALMMKKKMGQIQQQILTNIKNIAEN
ncbi:MAG: SRPBCC family protein [Bacteroidia bacterium]